jgi:hypothetical protein
MAIFSVLEPPDGRADRAVFIREGFSTWAFALSFFWALWHRMWVVAALLFAAEAALLLAAAGLGLDGRLAGAAEIALTVLFGFEARNLHALSLERAGYRPAGLVGASDLEAAELGFYAGRKVSPGAKAKAQSTVPSRTEFYDTLGIFGNVRGAP